MSEIEIFQRNCQHYVANYHDNIKWLYWELIPETYIGKNLDVEINIINADWIGETEVNHVSIVNEFGEKNDHKQFKQVCDLNLKVVLKSIILIPPQYLRTTVQFTANYLKPYLNSFQIIVNTDFSKAFNNFQTEILKIQNRFNLKSIERIEFSSEVALGFFCDVTRKVRSVQPQNSEIGNGSYFYQIVHAHEELATAISNLLSCVPFLSRFTDRKVLHEDDELFFPVPNPFNYKFNFWCSVCIERLYTFWETLIVLLYNYDSVGINARRLSFHAYFKEIEDKGKATMFNTNSSNYTWLKNFYKNDHEEIEKYRHRIVHHEFTSEHEGLLSAKFYINAYENVANKSQLEKLQVEIDAFPQLMIKHFNHCKKGFEKALLLIDELA